MNNWWELESQVHTEEFNLVYGFSKTTAAVEGVKPSHQRAPIDKL